MVLCMSVLHLCSEQHDSSPSLQVAEIHTLYASDVQRLALVPEKPLVLDLALPALQ